MTRSVAITFVLIFSLSFWILTRGISKPFVGIHDWNGARYGNIAKNYLKHSFESGLGQIEQKNPDGSNEYYTHYPPILPLAVAASYKILGISEAATRIVPALATSLTLMLIFFIGDSLWGWSVGLTAALIALAAPMVRYFGKNPVHEPLTTLFVTTVFLGLALIIKNKKQLGVFLVILGNALAVLTSWGGFFVAPVVVYTFWKNKISKKVVLLYVAILTILFLSHFLQVKSLTGSLLGGGLESIFSYRLGWARQEFSLLEFATRLRLWVSTLFTISLLLASVLWIFNLKKEGFSPRNSLIVGMFFFGLSYPLFFSNATYQHNYFIFGLTPALAISASLGVLFLAKRFKTLPYLFLASALVLLVAFERQNFLDALENSRTDELAYIVGRRINESVDPKSVILVTPVKYFHSRRPFLLYYGERTIIAEGSGQRYDIQLNVDEDKGSFSFFNGGTKWKYLQ